MDWTVWAWYSVEPGQTIGAKQNCRVTCLAWTAGLTSLLTALLSSAGGLAALEANADSVRRLMDVLSPGMSAAPLLRSSDVHVAAGGYVAPPGIVPNQSEHVHHINGRSWIMARLAAYYSTIALC